MFFITLPLLNVTLFSKSPYLSVHREINYEAGHTLEGFINNTASVMSKMSEIRDLPHCVKIVRIRSYSVLHFSAFGLNTER